MFKISVISDEISQDFSRIIAVAHDYPILQGVEPRSVWDKGVADLSDEECRTIKQRADDAGLRKGLLTTYGIEVGGGLGQFAGKAWRIGLMGHSARERSVTTLLGALRELLG